MHQNIAGVEEGAEEPARESARERLGFSQVRLAEAADVPASLVGTLERMEFQFVGPTALQQAGKLALFLEMDPDVLVPPELIGKELRTTFTKIADMETGKLLDAALSQEDRYITCDPIEMVAKKEIAEVLEETLDVSLSARRAKVVRLHCGLGGYEKHSFTEIGKILGISGRRVGQIFDRAIRVLQHPRNSRKVEEAAFGDSFEVFEYPYDELDDPLDER